LKNEYLMNRYALSLLNRLFDPEALDGSIPQIFNIQSTIFNHFKKVL